MDLIASASPAAAESGALPARAQRRAVEFPALLSLGDGTMHDVRVLDLSYDGCQIEAPKGVFEGDQVHLSVYGRGVIHARVRWCKDGLAGLRFSGDGDAGSQGAGQPRPRPGMEAQLRRLGRSSYWVELRDLSPDGCLIELVERPAIDEVMQVRLPGLETVQARVRWVDGHVAGLKFERPIHPAVFDLLLRRMGR